MAKRKRIDGAAGLQEIVADAALPPIKPFEDMELNEQQLVVWNRLVSVKARRAWTDQDLYALGDICIARVNAKQAQKSLDSLAHTEDNLPMIVKLQGVLDSSIKRANMLARSIQIHTEATQGKSREQVKQNQTHSGAQSNDRSIEDDGLIPRASTH